MVTIAEVENQAMQLPESDRAILAARLLGSLPVVLSDDELGIAEAMRRDAEMNLDSSAGLTLEQLRASLGR